MKKTLFRIKRKLGRVSPKEVANYYKNTGQLDCGENCEIHPSVGIGSEPYLIKMGNMVKITDGVKFFNHDGGMYVIRNLGWNTDADKMGVIVIGDNVFIGQNAIIMPGVKIGSNVIIGAGSLVSKDVPDNSVAAGVPANVKGSIEEYYNKNKGRVDNTKDMSRQGKKHYYLTKFRTDLIKH